jgi:hypothetical protein
VTWELTSVDGDFADLVSIKEANIAFRRVSFRLRVPLEQVPVDFGPWRRSTVTPPLLDAWDIV